jgi:hypothetical protein
MRVIGMFRRLERLVVARPPAAPSNLHIPLDLPGFDVVYKEVRPT